MSVEISRILIYGMISIGVGVIFGNGTVYLFNKLPPKWLCDYGEEPSDELKSNDRQRLRSTPFKFIFVATFTLISFQLLLNDISISIPALLAIFILIQIAISDIKYMIIPDQFLILLSITGLGFVPYYVGMGENIMIQPLGALTGAFIMLSIAFVVKLAYKRDGLGFGDIKLCALIGLLIGPVGVLLIIGAGFFFSSIVNIWSLARKKITLKDERPIGQYFCVATIIYILIVMSDKNIVQLLSFVNF